MHRQVAYALAHPVFEPVNQIVKGYFWRAERFISAGLTVNIGMEALRDRILFGCGTDEPWFLEDPGEFQSETGKVMIAGNWRKPLRIDEINQMAPTPEVRVRPGRP